MPNQNKMLVAILASIATGCGVLAIVAGVIVATYTWPATYEVACDLGATTYCDTINTIATIRLLSFIALVVFALLAGAFAILSIVYSALGRRPEDVRVAMRPMAAPPSAPLYYQQPMQASSPQSAPLPPTPQPIFGAYDPAQDDISGATTRGAGTMSARMQRTATGLFRAVPSTLILSVLSVALILVVLGGLLLFSPMGRTGWLTSLSLAVSPTQTPLPTATVLPTPTDTPTPTPILSSSAPIPGPGCGSPDWTVPAAQAQTDIQCTSSGLFMKSGANATVLTAVYWSGVGSPTSYAVRVTVSSLSSACGGIGFQNGYRGYVGYVCSTGGWNVIRYDSTGSRTQLGSGSVAQQSTYLIEISVTEDSVQFHIGDTTVYTNPLASGYDTASITLDLTGLYKDQPGQGYFSDFVYGR